MMVAKEPFSAQEKEKYVEIDIPKTTLNVKNKDLCLSC